MNAAAVQFFATPFALERNLQTAERLTREAAGQGARIIVLPELFNTGYVYTPRLFTAAERDDGPTLRWLKHLSAELKVLIGGAMLMRAGDRFFDTFVLVEPDGTVHKQRKRHPFVWEHCFFDGGYAAEVMETSVGKIGLLICWDTALRAAWEPFRGQVDLVLASSAPPRFHRAVLNFPQARKVYLADLMPELLPNRDLIDGWYTEGSRQGAAFVGAPVVHAVMAGRFVTEIPFPRLSFGLAALGRLRYLSWTRLASQATLRATFYGGSAIFNASGEVLGQVTDDESWVVREVDGAESAPQPGTDAQPGRFMFANVPRRLRWFDSIFRSLGRLYLNEHTR